MTAVEYSSLTGINGTERKANVSNLCKVVWEEFTRGLHETK